MIVQCEHIQKELKSYFEDLLTENDYQMVSDHLDQCQRCREYAGLTGSLSYLVKELGNLDVPEDLSATIRFRLDKKIKNRIAPTVHAGQKNSLFPNIFKVTGIVVVMASIYWLIVFGKHGDSKLNEKNQLSHSTDYDQAVVIESKGVVENNAILPHEEASYLYNQLQNMANSLEGIPIKQTNENTEQKTAQAQGAENKASPPDDSESDREVLAASIVPEDFSFHWHIPYTQDAQRDQLVNTVKILEIVPDFADQDFLVFKATDKQTKILVDGIEFISKTEMDVPEFVFDGSFKDRLIPISIYFIKDESYSAETQNYPIVKEDGVFKSFEQNAIASDGALDWHILIIPTQRDVLLNVIRASGGKIDYASREVAIFSVEGARFGKLINDVRSTGGVFADFGEMDLNDYTLMNKLAKVLIYFKEQ